MKKVNKVLGVLILLFILVTTVSNVFAVNVKGDFQEYATINLPTDPTKHEEYKNDLTAPGIKTKANSVMGTFVFLVQIACVATVVVMGLRYMLTSAEGKANVKKDLVVWCIGAVFVFGATTLIGLVLNVVVGDKQYVDITTSQGGENVQTSTEKHWAYDEWESSKKLGLVPESIKDKFAKDENISRGEFIESIYSLAGKYTNGLEEDQTIEKITGVHDIESDTLESMVMELYQAGIVTGTSGRNSQGMIQFDPNSDIKREDVAVVIYRLLKKIGKDDKSISLDSDDEIYNNVSGYAKEAMVYMKETGIIKGDDKGNLNPKGNTTCEEAIAIIYRIYKK